MAAVEIPYDERLQHYLEGDGLIELRGNRRLVIDACDDQARYNSALWFVMKYGLEYVYTGHRMIVTVPDAKPAWAAES